MQVHGDVLGMSKNFYVFSNGTLSADQMVFRFDSSDHKMVRVPIENVSSFDLYGGVTITSGALSLAAKNNICLHIFEVNHILTVSSSFTSLINISLILIN